MGRGSELPPQNKSPTPAASAKKTTQRDPNTGEPLVHYMPVLGYNGHDEHYPHAKAGPETDALNDWVWSVDDDDEKKARYAAVAKTLKYCRFRCREAYRKPWQSIAPGAATVIRIASDKRFVKKTDVWDSPHWMVGECS